ncbi:MAG: acetylxylan esterase, partial [Burkholderiales bacterium]|nr:acetylxylan esterase [Opitutaceae bacterium]
DTFWAEQKAALAKIAPDYQLTAAPDLSDANIEVFYLSFQNVGNWSGPSRFYGVLSVPRGPGPFPAVLNVPGAGVRAYTGNRTLAAKGVINLQVGIHGIPVNLPPEVYEQLGKGALSDYSRFQIDDRNRYYYRRVYLGAQRAADYLTTHPKWDGKNLIVSGGSQGGQLAIVTTALEPRVTGLVSVYPAYSDVTGYLRGTTGGWPGLFRTGRDGKVSDAPVEAKVVTTTYYDTVNFARRLRVPGLYSWGYNDETCPATSTFAAYNIITAPKQLRLDLPQGHSTSQAQKDQVDAWIFAQVGGQP